MIGNKSEIRFLKEDNYIKIGNLTEIGEFKRDREEINRTDYESKTVQTQLTLEDNGEISLMFNYNALNQAQEDVETLFSENAVIDWEFYINDENGTTLRFVGSVKSFSITSPNTDNVRIDASIRVNGGFTKVYPSKGIVRFTNFRSDDINLPARTMISKTVSNVKYSFRTTTKASLLGNSTVDVVVIGMNAGPVGNFPDDTSFSGGGSTFAIVSQGAFTGGNLDGTPIETPPEPEVPIEFTPNNDNTNKALVSITDGGSTITSTNTSDEWGLSGTFSTESISGDGYITFKVTQSDKYFMVGLSPISDESSVSFQTIDYAIYFRIGVVRIYENGGDRGDFIGNFDTNATYKINRTGNTITYLKNNVVFYTSLTTSNLDLHFDTAFHSAGVVISNVKMLS